MRRWPLSQDEPGLDVGAGMIRIGFLGGILAYNCIMGGILAYYNCRIRNPPKLVEVMIIKAPPKKKKMPAAESPGSRNPQASKAQAPRDFPNFAACSFPTTKTIL